MRLYAGTSGYAYKEWKGLFYPEEIKNDEMLAYYSRQLSTVEINNTFYRMPADHVVQEWYRSVPAGFRFIIKASRRITHIKRLKDPDDSIPFLYDRLAHLKSRLAAVLYQLPPSMKKDSARLAAFLETLPKKSKAAVEFRHVSWFDDEIFEILRRHNAALCYADGEIEGDVFTATADWGYVRLREAEYSQAELREWVSRLQSQDWKEVYVFFKHEDDAGGPELIRRFEAIWEMKPQASLKNTTLNSAARGRSGPPAKKKAAAKTKVQKQSSDENEGIALMLDRIVDFLELDGADFFRIRAHREGAEAIRSLPVSVTEYLESGKKLTSIDGIGKDLSARIEEYRSSGKVALLEELQKRVPPGLVDMKRIPGLGVKRVLMLHEKLGIDSVAGVVQAAEAGRISALPGMGKKTEENILRRAKRMLPAPRGQAKASGSGKKTARRGKAS